jgi:hypothetical protein
MTVHFLLTDLYNVTVHCSYVKEMHDISYEMHMKMLNLLFIFHCLLEIDCVMIYFTFCTC